MMHIERIDFDEVFDVQAGRGDFSFRSRGQVHYGVHLRPGTVPQAGAAWLVAFSRRGDWSSVLAWRNIRHGTIAFKEAAWLAMLSELATLAWMAPFFLVAALLLAGPGTALAVLLLICAYAGLRLVRIGNRNRRLRRALREVEGEGETTGRARHDMKRTQGTLCALHDR